MDFSDAEHHFLMRSAHLDTHYNIISELRISVGHHLEDSWSDYTFHLYLYFSDVFVESSPCAHKERVLLFVVACVGFEKGNESGVFGEKGFFAGRGELLVVVACVVFWSVCQQWILWGTSQSLKGTLGIRYSIDRYIFDGQCDVSSLEKWYVYVQSLNIFCGNLCGTFHRRLSEEERRSLSWTPLQLRPLHWSGYPHRQLPSW